MHKFFSGPSSSTTSSTEEQIHPAIEYLSTLQKAPPSTQLEEILSNFAEPKSIDNETFTKGVKIFIQLANSNPSNNQSGRSREEIYGNNYLGLHYINDLTRMWNSTNAVAIKKPDITTFAPPKWDAQLKNGLSSLIYKGSEPAQALDQLVKGPAIIDCGMFTQLSLWFGIRYVLGNERFNQYFGRAPFFITQLVYDNIKSSSKPYSGNPLYSFLSTKEAAITPSVTLKHIANTPLYPLKHPGGAANGHNCIIIDGQYYIFDPHLGVMGGITESQILELLREAFNEARTVYEDNRLSLYAKTPQESHPWLRQTYDQLIKKAKKLRDKTLSQDEFLQVKHNSAFEFTFDLHKFSTWLQCMEHRIEPVENDYLFQPVDYSLMPMELLDVIPFENKTSMDFSSFQQDTPQQKDLMKISKQFCQKVIAGESTLVILTGKAGVGKTASAVCAAKELATRGKRVAWISEVMVRGWADKVQSINDLDNCSLEIDHLLESDLDAVFLDDDNLSGFSGNLLLEKMYSWYVQQGGKGLFITSNKTINFEQCYGHKLDGYHYPPFNDYNSLQYQNWLHKTDLAGESLRSRREGQSIGAIVSDSVWKNKENTLGPIELVPAFYDYEQLVPIRVEVRHNGSINCSAYHKLRPVQKQWIRVQRTGESETSINGKAKYTESYFTVNSANFEKTLYKTIALEIIESDTFFFGKIVDSTIIHQLIRVINYAHDEGGRRVILINQTRLNSEELLQEIKQQLPDSEVERTWSRLMLLLCETEESIFAHDEFNGVIETVIPERPILEEKSERLNFSSIFSNALNRREKTPSNSKLDIRSILRDEHNNNGDNFKSLSTIT
ncbi:MAG: hypothetical protein Q8M03_04785 [Legionella sp.]|nr:hypothetical protein [Legionella sp.]